MKLLLGMIHGAYSNTCGATQLRRPPDLIARIPFSPKTSLYSLLKKGGIMPATGNSTEYVGTVSITLQSFKKFFASLPQMTLSLSQDFATGAIYFARFTTDCLSLGQGEQNSKVVFGTTQNELVGRACWGRALTRKNQRKRNGHFCRRTLFITL
jgi:hypothetical protein